MEAGASWATERICRGEPAAAQEGRGVGWAARHRCVCGLGPGASTQHSVLRGSMNSERPPESASSTPTGPGGSEGLREGPGYFLFESRRPFKHVTCVPRARPQQGQHASPAGRSHRRPRRRQGGKGWQGRRQGCWQGWWPCGAPDPLSAAALRQAIPRQRVWGLYDPYVKGGGPVRRAWRRGHPPLGPKTRLKRPFAACLFLVQLVRILRACLLMLSASPATAALRVVDDKGGGASGQRRPRLTPTGVAGAVIGVSHSVGFARGAACVCPRP